MMLGRMMPQLSNSLIGKVSRLAAVLFVVALVGCSAANGPVAGPDKQFSGGLQGAITGAGAGAATGFQMTAGTGPGAFIGAGFGAVAGGIQGASEDSFEELMIELVRRTRIEEQRAWAHTILNRHYQRRMELFPSRDIFPADMFFEGDSTKLSKAGEILVRELAHLNKDRLPWSRFAISVYVKSKDSESDYAKYLSKKRAVTLGDSFVRFGIEPRRIETRPTIISAPVVIDPKSSPMRYAQAIEFTPLDR